MSDSAIIYCVAWGSTDATDFKSTRTMRETFGDVSSARKRYDSIDLRELFASCFASRRKGQYRVFEKTCYIAEYDGQNLKPTAFLASDYYDLSNYAMDDLKRSELRW